VSLGYGCSVRAKGPRLVGEETPLTKQRGGLRNMRGAKYSRVSTLVAQMKTGELFSIVGVK